MFSEGPGRTRSAGGGMKDIFLLPEKEADMCGKARRGAIPLLALCSVLIMVIAGCSSGGGNAVLISASSTTTGSGTGDAGITSAVTGDVASNGSGTTSSGTSIPTKLAWDAPLSYEDGAPIEARDLTAYRIYLYTDPGLTDKYADYLVPGPVPPTSIGLSDLNNAVFADARTPATYYLAVTAIVTDTVTGLDIESAPSNVVSYTYP